MISAILKLLKTHACFSYLPSDARTILKTPKTSCDIVNIAGGEYIHLGFEESIKSTLKLTPINKIPSTLEIDFHIDGASLYNLHEPLY